MTLLALGCWLGFITSPKIRHMCALSHIHTGVHAHIHTMDMYMHICTYMYIYTWLLLYKLNQLYFWIQEHISLFHIQIHIESKGVPRNIGWRKGMCDLYYNLKLLKQSCI